jgi:hypothetical protein
MVEKHEDLAGNGGPVVRPPSPREEYREATRKKRAWRRLRRTWLANRDEFPAGITWEMVERTFHQACMDAEAKRLRQQGGGR